MQLTAAAVSSIVMVRKDDTVVLVSSFSVAAVTACMGVANITRARGRGEPPGQGMSVVVGMRPDSQREAQPAIGLVWRF